MMAKSIYKRTDNGTEAGLYAVVYRACGFPTIIRIHLGDFGFPHSWRLPYLFWGGMRGLRD